MAANGILASMSVVLGAEISDFQRKMAAARKELSGLSKFGEGLKDVGSSLTSAISAPLAALGVVSVKLAGDMEKANVNFEVMLGSAEKAGKVLNDLKDFAASTPFEFPEVQNAAKKLLAFNTPASELKTTLRQLGDIASGVDAPIGEIAEIYGKARVQGRLFQEDINQLTGRGIPIIQELAKQFGVSDGEVRKLVESGKVGFPQIQKAFADLTGEGGKFTGLMEKQSETIPGLVSSAIDAVKGAAVDFGTEIIEGFNLKGALKGFIGFVDGLKASFADLDPGVKRVALALGAAAIAIGPLLFGVGSLLTALVPLQGAFLALGGPIGLAVAAIAAGALLIIANWDDIAAYFSPSGEGGRVFGELATSVKASIAAIRDAISQLANSGSTLGDLIDVGKAIKFIFVEIATEARALIDTVTGVVNAVAAVLRGEFITALKETGNAAEALTRPFRSLLGLVKEAPSSGISPYFASFNNNIAGFLQIAPAATAALESVKTAAAALPALTQEQADALKELTANLRENQQLSLALGGRYDYLGERGKILESGIKSLVAAGFNPLGKTVQGVRAQIDALSTAYDQLETRVSKGIAAPKVVRPEDQQAFDVQFPNLPETIKAPVLDTAPLSASVDQSIAELKRLYGTQVLQEQYNASMQDLFQQLSSSLATLAVSAGEAFGEVLAGTASVDQALASILAQTLGVLTSFMKEFGKKLILTGAGNVALGNLGQGLAQIAAGLALGVGAGYASSAGKPKVSSSSASPSRSATPSASRGFTPTTPPAGLAVADANKTIEVKFEIAGSSLTAIGQIQADRLGRISGRR